MLIVTSLVTLFPGKCMVVSVNSGKSVTLETGYCLTVISAVFLLLALAISPQTPSGTVTARWIAVFIITLFPVGIGVALAYRKTGISSAVIMCILLTGFLTVILGRWAFRGA